MEGEAAAAILQVLVQNLIELSKNEISLIRGVDEDAAKLTGSLDTIQKLLNDVEMRTIPGDAVKSWLKKLENVAFDADNILDEFNYHLLSNKIKPIKKKVLSCFSTLNHIARPRKMGLRIRKINRILKSINKEATELGLVGRLAVVPNLLDATFETDSFTLDPIFIGRDDVVSEIVEMLTTIDERLIHILAVLGMGGLGKTTLTRKVFNHQKLETRFESHIWVHVSQTFDPIIIFKKILKELTSDQVENRQDILRKLQQVLKGKTYLLVLDDVWIQDLSKWEDFINSLLGVTSTNGNAIVVTTRNMEVTSIVNPLLVHQLKGLSEKDCWSIIKAKTFGKDDVPSEFEIIGTKIARRCQGLPLAANVVGGVLRNKSEEKWLSIEKQWLSRVEGDNITKILRLSFDNLSPPSLKKCFAYCSIFPKDRRIKKQELVEYWMAEGFLQGDGCNEMESVGHKYINILVHNSLLQVAERDDYGNVMTCVMHDLVHDLASSELGSSNNADGISRVRYMFVEHNSLREESIPIQKEVAKYLRTLLFRGEISSSMFRDLECVRVLTLNSYRVEMLPDSIRKLMHLRNLNVSYTYIENLPDWIGELHHLETLRAETRYLKKLPSTLKYLINLRHLHINSGVELPAEIGRLTYLQTLKQFTVSEKNGCKVEELGSLNNLQGEMQIRNLGKVHNKEDAEKANLYKKSKITKLWLEWDADREGETTNDESVLEGLQPHPNLKKLIIYGFKGKRFPLWTLKMIVRDGPRGSWVALNKLILVSINGCSECEEIPMLGQLPNLKSLRLERFDNLKCINSSFYGLVNKETRFVFPALERLELSKMPKLIEWAEVELAGTSEVKVFPHLQHLEMRDCEQLISVPTHFWSCLKHLEVTRIGSYMPLANIFRIKLAFLTNLCLEEINELEYLPDWLFYNNPNLSKLTVNKCPRLRELPHGLGTLNCLECLIIWECPSLERIADSGGERSQGSFTSLRVLQIYECHALVYLPREMVGSSLKILTLMELSSLNNLLRAAQN